MKLSRLGVLVMGTVLGATPYAAVAQTAGPTPEQTVTADGLQITLVSFERAPSRSVSLGGNCPPGGMVATVQAILKEGSVLTTAKVKMKVLPTYKPAQERKVVLQDHQDGKYETATDLGDLSNPGGKGSEYECSFQFIGPENVRYRSLQVGSAVFSLEAEGK